MAVIAVYACVAAFVSLAATAHATILDDAKRAGKGAMVLA